jgi:hypothetical protein
MKNVPPFNLKKLTTVLTGYGFCLEDNLHDSLSLKLTISGQETIYCITRSNPLPDDLVAHFHKWPPQSLREKLAPFKSKAREFNGYSILLHALAHKMGPLAGDIEVATEAGRYAGIYRQSQRELYIAVYDAVRARMQSVRDSTRVFSAGKLFRGGIKRRRRPEDEVERGMVRWLCMQFHDEPLPAETDTLDDDEQARVYVNRLKRGFYDRVDFLEWDNLENGEPDREVRHLYKRLKKEGLEVTLEMVRMATAMWDGESLRMSNLAVGAREVYERFGGDSEAVVRALGEGEGECDYGMFMEEVVDVGERKWTGQDILEIDF